MQVREIIIIRLKNQSRKFRSETKKDECSWKSTAPKCTEPKCTASTRVENTLEGAADHCQSLRSKNLIRLRKHLQVFQAKKPEVL